VFLVHAHSYVEMDGLIMPDAEGTPIGIGLSQGGNSDIIPATPPSSSSSSSSSGACNDPNSFKVAIVDSGLQADHPDVPCRDVNDVDTNCMGASFGIGDLPWYAPQNQAWHGTHVFGTIGATGNNGIGITSMVPNSDDNNICYMIVRVFGDDGGGQYASVLFEGINWAIGEGANVINMSLSGSQTYVTGQSTFNVAQARGILSVAAAGNGNSDSLRYPASYNHVISVAAVDNYGYVHKTWRVHMRE
jgi:serine protease